ncbi:hypothetical protein PUNSTDRAFT_105955 [Punctularia strigosozonata HHB-11173 SS5]|uniref:uncharacterized protein n=1 Tax=Punctularia strigosozonata (strain HHB-11173) TaxID=741275 RepID=UPI00044180E4|nr:uncharacterized protein PUNSTDRAFT_105955 [Punctularia strigosozonata HHB-11173 SS5]EIN06802.1 hypothetical protein PUNSTDRAFT_105955 [Punctularia strigosozonata HHB-11173 SS5]
MSTQQHNSSSASSHSDPSGTAPSSGSGSGSGSGSSSSPGQSRVPSGTSGAQQASARPEGEPSSNPSPQSEYHHPGAPQDIVVLQRRQSSRDTPTITPSTENTTHTHAHHHHHHHLHLQSRVTTPATTTEGYPSWLPRRAPAPEPASTMHTHSSSTRAGLFTPSPGPYTPADPGPSTGGPGTGTANSEPPTVGFSGSHHHNVGGRRPTPRSVRVVRMSSTDPRRIPTDTTRVGAAHNRVWSRATSAGFSPTVFSASPATTPHRARPRFRAPALHLDLVQSPGAWPKIAFWLWPLWVLGHVPAQTFLDFNAVFILVELARFPNAVAPGVPGSGRTWALGAAAYVACWAIWIVAVVVLYEFVYCFVRRWRVSESTPPPCPHPFPLWCADRGQIYICTCAERPLMVPLYLSAAGFNYVSMTSYAHFAFLRHLRLSAFSAAAGGSVRDGLAETCYYYSQNLPTVALLLPRAGLALALLLAPGVGGAAVPGNVASANRGAGAARDGTYFGEDGRLTAFGRGVLFANCAWVAWRALVLLFSWIGLWILSGHGCAGLCGPRYRWEEDEAEKTMSVYSEGGDPTADVDPEERLPWEWRECTAARVQEAWELCLTERRRRSLGLAPHAPHEAEKLPRGEEEGERLEVRESGPAFEGVDRILAAIGLGGSPPAARRGLLSEHLFREPEEVGMQEGTTRSLGEIIPKPEEEEEARMKKERRESLRKDAPLMKLPYPFPGYDSQDSKEGRIPFPPSPTPGREGDEEESAAHEVEAEEEEEEEEEGEHAEESYVVEGESEEPSSGEPKGRSSGSMSSLGRPVASRYPFQFRRPVAAGGRQSFSTAGTHRTPQSKSTSTGEHSRSTPSTHQSQLSRGTVSTAGNRASVESPWGGSSASAGSPVSGRMPIPMPPSAGRQRRAWAGTVPVASVPSSPSPNGGRTRSSIRTRTESGDSVGPAEQTFGPIPLRAYGSPNEDGDEEEEVEEEPEVEVEMMEQPEAEGSQEAAEIEDEVALLSPGPSPKSSRSRLRQQRQRERERARTLSHRSRSISHRSHSGSGSASHSGGSHGGMRSRTQSLIQSISAASRSSVDVVASAVRSRTSSMTRLEEGEGEEQWVSGGSGSGTDALPSSPEGHTFGIGPVRGRERERGEAVSDVSEGEEEEGAPGHVKEDTAATVTAPARTRERQQSMLSATAPSERTIHPPGAGSPSSPASPASPAPIPEERPPMPTMPSDVSTANESFVTAPATVEGSSDSAGAPSSWGGSSRFFEGGPAHPKGHHPPGAHWHGPA